MDLDTVASQMPTLVPMVATLRLEFLEVSAQRAVLRLPDQPEYHNHLGGPHAGAMFTLAESATGALVLGNFGRHLHVATPLAVEGRIRYRRVAMGPVYAEALLVEDGTSIMERLSAGERPEFLIDVTLSSEDWAVTGQAEFLWTLRPVRSEGESGRGG